MSDHQRYFTSQKELFSFLSRAEAIIFDLDGTLFNLAIDWQDIRHHIMEGYFQQYGQNMPELTYFFQIYEFIEMQHGKEATLPYLQYQAAEELSAVQEFHYAPTWLATNGMNLIAQYIRFDTFFGIVSGNFHETIVEILTHFNMLERFRVIIGRNDVNHMKPNPEGLFRIIDGYDLSPDTVLFIGDMDVDKEAAKRAHIPFLYSQELQALLE